MSRHIEIGVAELRTNLRQHIRQAADGNPVVITKDGYPLAALISVEDLRRLDRLRIDGGTP